MSWKPLIDRNHRMLMQLCLLLSGMIGASMPRGRYLAALRLMRPAESALRRLIVIAAQGLRVTIRSGGGFPKGGIKGKEGAKAAPCFPLFDPRRHPVMKGPRYGGTPRIRFIDEPYRVDPAPEDRSDAPVDTARLVQRLARFERALTGLPREARRLARWRLTHPRNPRRPMRPGRPPGHRARPIGEADFLLRDLQGFALDAWSIDSS